MLIALRVHNKRARPSAAQGKPRKAADDGERQEIPNDLTQHQRAS